MLEMRAQGVGSPRGGGGGDEGEVTQACHQAVQNKACSGITFTGARLMVRTMALTERL